MYRFLIQSGKVKNNNKIPLQDFGYEVIKAIEYYDWLSPEKRYDYELITSEKDIENYLTENTIPVGTVEFVLEFIRQCYGIQNVEPLNIPTELIPFANRKIWYIKKSEFKDNLDLDKEYFIKSATRIKGYTYMVLPRKVIVPDDTYMVSEIIDISSEWRCFVKNGELLDIRCYSGNPFKLPSIPLIEEMIKAYKSCPPAYTLDVCLETNGKTSIIECHNFFSCGLYGFSDYKNYPIMLIRAFKWQVDKGLQNCVQHGAIITE